MAISTSIADMIKKLSSDPGLAASGSKNMFGSVLSMLQDQGKSLEALPGINTQFKKGQLADQLAGEKGAALQQFGGNLKPKDLDMINRSIMGSRRVGENAINEQGRQAEMEKFKMGNDLTSRVAEIAKQIQDYQMQQQQGQRAQEVADYSSMFGRPAVAAPAAAPRSKSMPRYQGTRVRSTQILGDINRPHSMLGSGSAPEAPNVGYGTAGGGPTGANSVNIGGSTSNYAGLKKLFSKFTPSWF